jgi:hypothetical protein
VQKNRKKKRVKGQLGQEGKVTSSDLKWQVRKGDTCNVPGKAVLRGQRCPEWPSDQGQPTSQVLLVHPLLLSLPPSTPPSL